MSLISPDCYAENEFRKAPRWRVNLEPSTNSKVVVYWILAWSLKVPWEYFAADENIWLDSSGGLVRLNAWVLSVGFFVLIMSNELVKNTRELEWGISPKPPHGNE